MKKQNVYICLLATFVLLSCNSQKKHEKNKTKHIFSVAKNEILWTGGKMVGSEHMGVIQFSETNLEFEGDDLVGGTLIVDMTTIKNIDLEGEWREKLEAHLRSEDFFDVTKFPTAKLTIKKVMETNENNLLEILADITIKDITNEHTFLLNVKKSDKKIIYTGMLDIDRSMYDVRYGSSSFFQDLGDKAINDVFTLDAQVVIEIEH